MFALSRVVRSKATGLVTAQTARVASSTVQSSKKTMVVMTSRYQSTMETPEVPTEKASKPETPKSAGKKVERKPDPVLVKATANMNEQIASGASTKVLLDSLIQHLDELRFIGSRAGLGREFVIPIMQRSIEEINDPEQRQLVPTPQDILNKTITYNATPQRAFSFVARWLLREGHSGEILPLWVSYLEYKADARFINKDAEEAFKRIALLAYIESAGEAADIETIKKLLQAKLPDSKSLQSELRSTFPKQTPISKKLNAAVEKFYLKTRDPNSIQSLTSAFASAQTGRSQPVFSALSTARKISRASGEPLKEETIVAFMKMFNMMNQSAESMKLWNELVSAGVSPSISAWNALLLAVSKTGAPSKRLGQVEAVRQKIPQPDTETDAVLILIYARAQQFERVEEIVKAKLDSSPLIAQAYVQALAINNDYAKIQDVISDLKNKGTHLNTETYNNILAMLSRTKKYQEVHALLDEMIAAGCTPDIATYTILIDLRLKSLRAQGEAPTDETFSLFFSELDQQGIKPNEYTLTAIMDGLAKSGGITTAQSLFNHLQNSGRASIVTYTSIISGEFKSGRVKEAEAHFKEFLSEGYQVRPQHWAALFEGFSRNGKSTKCLEYLEVLDELNQSQKNLNKYSYYFMIKVARDQKDAALAEKVFEVIEKNKTQRLLTPPTLMAVKDLRDQEISIPESILALL